MTTTIQSLNYTFSRYLSSKKSVDDRALNRQVWRALADSLAESTRLPECSPATPLRVLEIGAGIGTMVERTLEWGLLGTSALGSSGLGASALRHAEYTALDAMEENIAVACERLPRWATANGYRVQRPGPGKDILLQKPGCRLRLRLEAIDLFDFIARETKSARWDVLIAHAFLDLMDIPATLPQLFGLLAPGGLFYFTINFDGATLFEPVIDERLDELIQVLYHRTMDQRITNGQPSGDSRAGRHLFQHIRQAGGEILAAGASDWVVFPGPLGYPNDEAYFLHYIIHTIQQALHGHPELDAARLDAWITRRHAQVENRELIYIAHQLDFAGRLKQLVNR